MFREYLVFDVKKKKEKKVIHPGFEPGTLALKVRYSTN